MKVAKAHATRHRLTLGQAVSELVRQAADRPLVTEDRSGLRVLFRTETLQLPAAIKGIEPAVQGYRQLTDAYLLALANRRKGVLATFDRGLRSLAGGTFDSALEIVPTR